jgi:hypothetical protein
MNLLRRFWKVAVGVGVLVWVWITTVLVQPWITAWFEQQVLSRTRNNRLVVLSID